MKRIKGDDDDDSIDDDVIVIFMPLYVASFFSGVGEG